jgi:hypothetical protein
MIAADFRAIRGRLVALCPGAPGAGEADDEQDDPAGDAEEDEAGGKPRETALPESRPRAVGP